MEYFEEYYFPNGLVINFYSEPDKDYRKELKSLSSQEELDKFLIKWRDIDSKIPKSASFELVKKAFDPKVQEEMVTNDDLKDILNIILPPMLLKCMVLAEKYMVTVGLVMLQLLNSGCIEIKEGQWFLKEAK